MENLVVFKGSCVSGLLSDNGLTCGHDAIVATNEIKAACKELGVYVTFLSNGQVSFMSLYVHTINVPAKATKSLEAFKEWTINRIKHYYDTDKARFWSK